jgi:hypothetical protein
MKSVYRRHGLVFLAFCVATGWGCGKPGPKLVPVSGVVVNGNKPVTGAYVVFAADVSQGGQTLDAYGSTDKEGHFTLRTTKSHAKGTPAGRYKVVISTDGPSPLIPRPFTTLDTTPLQVDVPESGTEDLKLDLSKQER